jgi:hypothetical protein
MMAKIKEHRDEYLGIFNQSEEERARSEKIKYEKVESDNVNLTRLINSLEKKIDHEGELRTHNEEDIRSYLETKFLHISD